LVSGGEGTRRRRLPRELETPWRTDEHVDDATDPASLAGYTVHVLFVIGK